MGTFILGLDSSTQSLSAIVIEIETRSVVSELSINFSQEFPDYHTVAGVLPHPDPQIVHAPPLIWVAALERIFVQLADSIDLSALVAISGSAQQHGSVYLKSSMNACLAGLDPQRDLVSQLNDQFTRATAPTWMDSSSSVQCAALTEDCAGDAALCSITGSPAIERFTGAQIKKFADDDPAAYAATGHICLVSSFLSSLLLGRIHGIDYCDASGMNLLDLRQRQWHPAALASCGPGLADKLAKPIDPRQVIGCVSEYFQRRFGLSADCQVIPFSGDNPCSLIGLGLIEDGMTAISLGTSDTLFGHFSALPSALSPWAHVFIAPTNAYMSLLCFKNGSLARETVRKQFNLSWNEFSAAIESCAPGNNSGFMLPWFTSETVPKVLQPSVRQFHLDPHDPAAQCRGVVESQMLSMRLHAAEAGLQPHTIRVTGGASQNSSILQIMADVFQCPVTISPISNSAALGAALRALYAVSPDADWHSCVADFTTSRKIVQVLPQPAHAAIYDSLLQAYIAAESAQLKIPAHA